jgi:hypothetical protein
VAVKGRTVHPTGKEKEMELSVRGQRIKTRTVIASVAAAGLIGGAIAIAPHLKSSEQIRQVDFSGSSASSPQPVKLTCSNWNGGAGFLDWDILVQLNPDGTAASAAALGDAYTTGVSLTSVERTDPPVITIDNSGRHLHFSGSALIQAGIPGTSLNFSGPSATCNADFSFPNPQSPVINLEPSS